MPAWLIPALIGGASATVGAALTRRDNEKEAARVAAANKAEAARVAEANKKEAAAVEEMRMAEQYKAIQENTEVRENYYKNVVSDAQSAGINPLTALRTGAGSAYGNAVAGTIRQPVMRDGVYLEGVYQTPTLSRNPIAAGLEAATNIGLADFTRQKQYTHESRMDDLRRQLMTAQIKSYLPEVGKMSVEVNSNLLKNNMGGTLGSSSEFFKPLTSTIGLTRMSVKGKDYVSGADVKPGWSTVVMSDGTVTAIPGEEVEPLVVLGAEGINYLDKIIDFNGDRKFKFYNDRPSKGLKDRWQNIVNDALR